MSTTSADALAAAVAEELAQRPPAASADRLTKVYRPALGHEILALNNLTLEVREREILGLIGPNGSGKTTTLKLLLGLIFPTSGEARIFGESPRSMRAKARIGFMPEGPFFYQHLSGEEVIKLFGSLCGMSRSELRERTNELLELVGMSKRRHVRIGECSKGMIQRIGLAAALVNEPDLMMMDEPTSGLDPIAAREIKDLIVELRDRGKTLLIASHLLEQVEEICDRVAILDRGQLLRVGTLEEVLVSSDDNVLVVRGLSQDGVEQLKRLATQVESEDANLRFRIPGDRSLFDLVDIVKQGRGEIISFGPFTESLESVFIKEVAQRPEGQEVERE